MGLYLDKDFSELGASPDGLVFDKEDSKYVGLIEIKCPYYTSNFTLDQIKSDALT